MTAPEGPCVLAQALGVHWRRAPAADLREHFTLTWAHVLPAHAPRPLAVVPDGHADLEWIDGRLVLAGPNRRVNVEILPPSTVIVGVRFRPGALTQWLGSPASALVDRRIALEDLWGGDARLLAQEVADARDPMVVAERLEFALGLRARGVAPPGGEAAALLRAIASAPPEEPDITARLCGVLGVSERTLRRRSHEAFGYGPKTLQRIIRFHRFLALSRGRVGGLAVLAAESGYADHAHLAREARAMTGMTPTMVQQQLAGVDAECFNLVAGAPS